MADAKTQIAQAYVQIIPSAEGIKNNLGKTLGDETEKASNSAGKEAGKNFMSSFQDAMGSAGGKMASAGKALSVGITAPITALGTASVTAWKEVDNAMDTIVTKTGASGAALQDMQDRASAIATTLPVSFQEAGDAIGEVNTRFGLTGDALQELSAQFTKFASINGTDVSTSVDSVQSALAAFGLTAEDADDMLNVLNKAGQDTGVNVVQLSNELTANAGTLKEMGYNASDSAMLLANLSKNGVDTTAAMTGLKKVYAESVESGKPMSELLGDLTTRLQDNATADKAAQDAADLFGTRAAASLIPALKEGRLSFDAMGTSMTDFAGNVSSTYESTLDPMDQMTVNMNKLKETGASLVNTAAPMITEAMSALSTVIEKVTSAWNSLDEGQQQTIMKVAGIAAVAGPALGIGGKVITTVGNIGGKIGDLVSKLGSFSSSAGSAASNLTNIGSAAGGASGGISGAATSFGQLAGQALSLVALGAGIALAGVGIKQIADAAVEVGQAGPAAQIAMVGMVGAIAGLAAGAAALGPALTAGAVGFVAFGTGVTLVGAGIGLASAGMALLASQLPTVSTYGLSAATALGKIALSMTKVSGAAVLLGAGFTTALLPLAGAALTIGATDLALAGLAGTLTLSAGGAGLLGASMSIVASSVESISQNAAEAGSSLQEMNSSVSILNTAVDGLKSKFKDAGDAIAKVFTQATPTATAAAKTLASTAMTAIAMQITVGSASIMASWSIALNQLNTTTRLQMAVLASTIKGSLNEIQRTFANTQLSFNQNIKVPHFSLNGAFDVQSGRVPTVNVSWYRKAYDDAYMLNGATIFGAMNGNLLGGGDGRGSEMVVGTDKMIEMIREAVGSAGFTQNLTINSPTELSPAEVARRTKNANRQMVLALKGMV